MSIDMAYFAGFFDGEGTIIPQKNGTWPTIQVRVKQVNPAPLRLLHEEFGGSLWRWKRPSSTPNARPIWEWYCSARKARVVLEALLPYLIVKRAEAESALAYQQHVSAGKNGRILPEDEAKIRQNLLDNWYRIRYTSQTATY